MGLHIGYKCKCQQNLVSHKRTYAHTTETEARDCGHLARKRKVPNKQTARMFVAISVTFLPFS